MASSTHQRFGLVFSTQCADLDADLENADRINAVQEQFDEISGAAVVWGNLARDEWGNVSSSEAHKNALEPANRKMSNLESSINGLLDRLPRDLAYNLDVIWFSNSLDNGDAFPGWMYSALKRAQWWNGAKIAIVSPTAVAVPSSSLHVAYVDDLFAKSVLADDAAEHVRETFAEGLVWRGSINVDTNVPGFELVSLNKEDVVADILFKQGKAKRLDKVKPKRLSRKLKVMTPCKLEDVDPKLLTDRMLSLRMDGNSIAQTFLKSAFRDGQGLLARLQYCNADAASGSIASRSAEAWKKSITNGDVFRSGDEGMEKRMDEVYFLLFCREFLSEAKSQLEMVAVVLEQSDNSDLTRIFDERPLCIDMAADDLRLEEVALQLRAKLPGQQTERMLACPSQQFIDYLEDTSLWPETKFINLVESMKKSGMTPLTQRTGIMTPSGDYVLLEAEELLKHFSVDGSAAKSPNEGEEVRAKRKTDYAQELQVWPMAKLQDFHGLHYNRCERSEDMDREAARVQKTYVGVERETASTCNSMQAGDAKDNIVSKSSSKSDEVVPMSRIATRPRTAVQNRQQAASLAAASASRPKTKEEVFKQKLRSAVYQALEENDVNEESPLFRTLFKKLFVIVQMYGKDVPQGSTSGFLLNISRQQAVMVINLHKDMLKKRW